VADSFDAMTNNRPYRNALSPEIALEELRKNRYVQFDGEVVDLFLPLFEKGNS
jgi:HD-GYP domain-containing protein (c-di-GMP phosphodiesterase class II)